MNAWILAVCFMRPTITQDYLCVTVPGFETREACLFDGADKFYSWAASTPVQIITYECSQAKIKGNES